jgi:hypothetical protein
MEPFKLSDIWKGFPVANTKNSTIKYKPFGLTFMNSGFSFSPRTNTLPGTGETYQTPVPVQTPVVPSSVQSVTPGYETANTSDNPLAFGPNKKSVFTGGGTGGGTPPPPPPPALDYSKYTNPATGQPYTPQEYADMMAKRAGGGMIPTYAGDALTNPNQTAEQLQGSAYDLNNARNDIATGATDPYKVASQSRVQYTPAQLKAIESAYAGVYDPALQEVFLKLEEKKKIDQQALEDKTWYDRQKFSTEENIRQYNATTGENARGKGIASLGLQRGVDGYVDPYAYMDKARAFETAGGSMKKFLSDYPPTDYLNPAALDIKLPTGEPLIPNYVVPKQTSETATQTDATIWKELGDPANANMSDEDKYYYITSKGRNPESFGIYYKPPIQ